MDARAALLELQKRIERRFDPEQLRDSEGKWTDGPVGAATTYTLDAFRRLYGDEVDDRYAGDFYVSVHERGDFVLSFMHEDGKREILLDGLNAERANAIADGLDWAATAHLSDDDENDPDTGLVDYAEVDDGIVVGYTEVGDVSLRLPKDDDARPGVPDEYEVLDIDASDATDLERALRDMADAYDELGDEEDSGDGVTEEPQSARARVLALADEIRRKYNPGQLRDPGGEGGGQWVKSPGSAAEAAGKDLLELAGRIDLDPREKLVSSDRLNGDNGGDVDLNWAVVHSPAGNEVRLGVIPHFDADKWRAGDHGGTAILDDGQVRKFREDLRGAVAEAKAALKEAADRFDPDEGLPANPTERDKVLFGLEPVARGVLQTDWEDLHWNVYLSDQEDEPWLLSIGAGDPDTNEADPVQFAPKKVGKLLTSLGRIESDLAETSRSRRGLSRTYAADGGGTRTGKETTTTNTGPKGGQFAPGGGRVGGKGKPPPKRRPAKTPAKPAGPLGYDGKTGAGYGIKGGDARVRTLQSVLNRFGLKDSSGQPLAVDGKFGPRTTAAVKRLQRAMGEEPTGKVTEDFIKRVSNAKSLQDLRPPKPPPKPRKRVRRSADHLHELDNGICRTCISPIEHVLDNGICVSCGDVDPKGEASRGARHRFANGVCVTCDDQVVRALIEAFDEILRTRYVRTPAGSKRYGLPIGSPIGGGGAHLPAAVKPAKSGRTTLKDRIVSALEAHLDGKGDGEPLAGFSREHLRQAAKARGIRLDRGEHRDSIAKKLIDHLDAGRGDTKTPKSGKAPKSILKPGRDRLAEVAAHYRDNPADYEGRRRKSYDTPYDVHLKEIVELQGFDAKPQVGTREQVDAAVASGWVETWRGVGTLDKTPAEINHDLRFGDFEPGRGIYGNGVYASTRRGTAETFRNRDPKGNYPIGPGPDYGPEDYEGEERPDSLLRIAIDPKAKVGDYDELDAEVKRYFHSLPAGSPESKVLADVGRYAAARGYDVMIVRNHGDGGFYPGFETDELDVEDVGSFPQADQYVVLNRSAIMIQRAEDVP